MLTASLCMPTGVPGLDAVYRKAIKQEPLSRGHMDPLAINSFNKSFMFHCGSRTRQGTLYLLTGTSEFSLTSYLGRKPVQDSNVKLFLGAMLQDETMMTLVVPRAVWTAGCCVWKESIQEFGKVRKAESFAVMSNNVKDKKLLNQTQMSVLELERHLTAPLSSSVNLFPGDPNCRLPENNKVLS